MLKPALVFQNGCVLQRNQKVSIFGEGNPSDTVKVTIQGKEAECTVDGSGKWICYLPALDLSFEETLTVSDRRETIAFTDVAVGEVWLAGGQSNMEYYMRYDREYPKEKETCSNPDIRFFDYPEVSYDGQLEKHDYMKRYAFWRKADPEDLQYWSAVPYYFAQELNKKYHVPVGILGCNWGGTPVTAWMPEEAIKECGAQAVLEEYAAAVKDLDTDAYNAAFDANTMNDRSSQLEGEGHELNDWIMSGNYGEDMMVQLGKMVAAQMAAKGIDPSKIDMSSMAPQMGPRYERRPGGLYETMLKPLAPYTIRGVIWYQGESDGDELSRANDYTRTFPAMISSWRALFNAPDLPFLFVQIAPYERWMEITGTNYGIIRRAQQWTADHIENTGMAVITDNGMRWDIHPLFKRPVGHRLFLQAENKVYGERDVLCEAPTLISFKAETGKLTLTFANAGEGLHFAAQDPYGHEIPEGFFSGLRILQNGKQIDPASCTSTADGSVVSVVSEEIQEGADTEVHIADDVWYTVNLYNSADIPARVTW